jgi:hypothetical protein
MHNEEFHNLYSSPNIIRMAKWRRMRWIGQYVWERRGVNRGFCCVINKERDHQEDLIVNGRKIFNQILEKIG